MCDGLAGKRTYGGLIDDGVKSGMRYFLNNFFDGSKQDALDLLTGTYALSKGAAQCPCYMLLSGIAHPTGPLRSASEMIAHNTLTSPMLCWGCR